jgi:hypothetical protein
MLTLTQRIGLRSQPGTIRSRSRPAWRVLLVRPRNRTLAVLGAMLLMALSGPGMADATSLNDAARTHFTWLEQVVAIANGVVPLVSMLAIVGGLIMWGLSGGNEGVMKKLGPVVAAFGVAGFILSTGSFLGIGASVVG